MPSTPHPPPPSSRFGALGSAAVAGGLLSTRAQAAAARKPSAAKLGFIALTDAAPLFVADAGLLQEARHERGGSAHSIRGNARQLVLVAQGRHRRRAQISRPALPHQHAAPPTCRSMNTWRA